jgi:hypothetical protein
VGDYAVDITYTKQSIAAGVRLYEGLERFQYNLKDWQMTLPRFALLHLNNLPDVRGLGTITWRNYQGLTVVVAARPVTRPVTSVRVYRHVQLW